MNNGFFVLMFLIFIVGIVFTIYDVSTRSDRIHCYITSMGGSVIMIEKRGFFSGTGPFMFVGKGRAVYRFEYELNGVIHEGWVRFGGLMGPDWRL